MAAHARSDRLYPVCRERIAVEQLGVEDARPESSPGNDAK